MARQTILVNIRGVGIQGCMFLGDVHTRTHPYLGVCMCVCVCACVCVRVCVGACPTDLVNLAWRGDCHAWRWACGGHARRGAHHHGPQPRTPAPPPRDAPIDRPSHMTQPNRTTTYMSLRPTNSAARIHLRHSRRWYTINTRCQTDVWQQRHANSICTSVYFGWFRFRIFYEVNTNGALQNLRNVNNP